jgi:hypothetical protein
MSWTPVVALTFENHAAVDHSEFGNSGKVELPGPDRWVDAPIPQVPTAIRYDHPESKITVPANSTLANWAGFRVAVTFRPAAFNLRINLVEGDRSFAFFVEPDGRLKGTIYDGSQWYGVESAPGTIVRNRWYYAEYRYDPASALLLHLDGNLVGFEVTHGDPVRPVQPVGIKIGYWPGGDSRYTFLGLMGSVVVSKLDPEDETIDRLGKFVCRGFGQDREIFDTLLEIVRTEMTPQERTRALTFGRNLVAGAKDLMAATLGTASNREATLGDLQALSRRAENLLVTAHVDGRNYMRDPEYAAIVRDAKTVVENTSNTARATMIAQVIRLVSNKPLSDARVNEMLEKYPGLKECFSNGDGGGLGPDDNPFDDWFDDCVWICPDGTGSGGGDTDHGGNHGDGGGRPPCDDHGDKCCKDVHVHVHCCSDKED